MRIAQHAEHLVLVVDGGILDVDAASGGQFGSDPQAVFEHWDDGQDLSDRPVQLRPPAPQFSPGKSFPGFGPTGPWLVTPDELDDPDDLPIGCSLNGQQMQESRTSDLIFGVPTLIQQLSSISPLLPGDLIFTGTPSGVGGARTPPQFLTAGDDGIGAITTYFTGPEA